MIIKVDGWLYRVPSNVEFLEFSSSSSASEAGGIAAFDKNEEKVNLISLGLPLELTWMKRIPVKKTEL